MNLDKKIGTGAQADVYLYNNKAIKIFRKGYDKSFVFYEAMITSLVENGEVPIAKVHEVLRIDGKLALSMDYISGVTLNELFKSDVDNVNKYLEIMVGLQIKVHSQKVDLPIRLNNRLKEQITGNKDISHYKKQRLTKILEGLPDGNNLCHGDFHWNNIINHGSEYYIIDWIDAAIGCVNADACRTYMLYLFHCSEFAELYLSIYCAKTGKATTDILQWLPVVAAARLCAGFEEEKERIYLLIKDIE